MGTYLIAEDDPLHRDFLREVIALSEIGCDLVVAAENGDEAIKLSREHAPVGVILDLQMPEKTGVQAAKGIWALKPSMPIIFWSNYADEAYVRGIARIVPTGATYGYLLKTASRERLRRAIQCVFAEGQNVIDREVRGFQRQGASSSDTLTEREYEVLLDVAIGLTDRAIAVRRNMSMRSIQARLQQLYSKLALTELPVKDGQRATYNTRTRAVAVALMTRLINGKAVEAAEAEYQQERGGPK